MAFAYHSYPYCHTSICLSYSLHSFQRYIRIPIRSEQDAESRAGANVIYREIEPIRSGSTRPAKRTAPRMNRPTATPLLFFVHANPPDLYSVPYIQRYEQICNRCFLLSFILRGVADKWFFLFRFANLYVYPHVFFF